MSDTPRTDTASRESTAFDTPTNAINFARQLERENAELRKDKERLDWLIEKASIHLEFKHRELGTWWLELDENDPRRDIDKAMEESARATHQ